MPIPKKNSAPERRSAKDLIYETLCGWIIQGEMMPGEKLLDTELSAYFNVSRTPVREALQMLETQKLIKVAPGRATTVAEIDKADIEKCYRPLAEIQGLAARLAAPRLTQAQFAGLEEAQAKFERACGADEAEAAIACDNRFHDLIMEAADNEYITEYAHMLLLHVMRIKFYYFHKDPLRKASIRHHKDILEALGSGDGELAADRMRSHWLYVMDRCLRDVALRGMQEKGE